jgi:Fungal chitosanase of glycosyl hydrolase group 75
MKSVVLMFLVEMCFPVCVIGAVECQRTAVLQLKNSASSSEKVPLWTLQRPQETAFFFRSGVTIDADGAPKAYHPVSAQGLDALGSAGKPGNWWALVTNNGKLSGTPVLQKENDPAPGFYISTTALEDTTKERTDPKRYVDSSTIPYVVIPPEAMKTLKAKMGDFAVVINSKNHKLSHAIVADQGPKGQIGEGSIALAEALGIPSNPRHGGVASGILYLVFPGSGNGKPRPLEEITAEATRLFEAWGGTAQMGACFP